VATERRFSLGERDFTGEMNFFVRTKKFISGAKRLFSAMEDRFRLGEPRTAAREQSFSVAEYGFPPR